MTVIFIILLLILLNAYFSLAEIALVSVKKSRLKEEADKGNVKARKALELVEDPEEFLSSVQVGITLLGIVEGLYGGEMVAHYVEPVLAGWGLAPATSHVVAMVGCVGLITYLTIVLGELIPKSVALQSPAKTSLAVAPTLLLFTKIAYPFVKLLTVSTHFFLRLFSVKGQAKEKISENELRRMLSLAYEQGVLEKQELVLHENIFRFNDLTADRIMTPRRLVTVIALSQSRDEIAGILRQSAHSYFPVYKPGRLEVQGYLSAKEFFMYPEKKVEDLVQPASFVSLHQTASEVFRQMKKERRNFGVVINEYGDFEGIITQHDIGEGVFGYIPDPAEDKLEYLVKQPDKSWLARGIIRLNALRELLSLEWLKEYESEHITLAGLLMDQLQHVPKAGETVVLHNTTFEVREMKDYLIDRVLIRMPQPEALSNKQ